MKKFLSILIILAMVVSQGLAFSEELAILYTNDVHCAAEDNMGYVSLLTLKEGLKALGYDVLLADAGDAVQGGALGLMSRGESVVDIMNLVEYDIAIPGNHEFDYGFEQFNKLVQKANFPYVSANLYNLQEQKHVLPTYHIVEKAGLRIAFVGVTTPNTVTSSTPIFFKDDKGAWLYSFGDAETMYQWVQKAVDDARKENADYVILLSHLGISEEDAPYLSSDLIQNTTGIDAVIDGHSHSEVQSERVKNKEGKPVLLTQTGTKLNAIGLMTLKDGQFTSSLIKGGEKVSNIHEIVQSNDAFLNEVVANVDVQLVTEDPETGIRLVRNNETNLGDFCADAFMYITKSDIAISNGGGIRAQLNKGEITQKNILDVYPFGNTLVSIQATGAEILSALEWSVYNWPEEFGGFLQVSGIEFTVHTDVPSPVVQNDKHEFVELQGEPRVTDVYIQGEALDLEKTYTVASTDYIVINGGNGYTMFKNTTPVFNEGMLCHESIVAYLNSDMYKQNVQNYQDVYGQARISFTKSK